MPSGQKSPVDIRAEEFDATTAVPLKRRDELAELLCYQLGTVATWERFMNITGGKK